MKIINLREEQANKVVQALKKCGYRSSYYAAIENPPVSKFNYYDVLIDIKGGSENIKKRKVMKVLSVLLNQV